jgi:hypothetical protein
MVKGLQSYPDFLFRHQIYLLKIARFCLRATRSHIHSSRRFEVFFKHKCIQNQSRPILDVDILLGNFPANSGNLPYHRLLAATILFYYNKQKLSIAI